MGAPAKGVKTCIKYGIGIDEYKELFLLGTELGLIDKSGSWFKFNFISDQEETPSAQGEQNSVSYLRENPHYTKQLNDMIRSIYFGQEVETEKSQKN